MSENLKVAVVQMTSGNNAKENETTILNALAEIESKHGQSVALVAFPENVWFFRVVEGESLPNFGEAKEFHTRVQAWVEKNKCAVVLGAVPVLPQSAPAGAKPFAATAVFEPGREWHVPYTKVHLFDVDVAGHKPVRESDHLARGEGPAVWNYRGWKFGCAICYDVRFAELFSRYAAQEVDALFLPSAFLVPTGRQHWEILVRARAIESQAYLMAAAQSGDHVDPSSGAPPRKTYGRSMIVDPWGRMLEAAAVERSGTEILVAELNREEIMKVRTQIPMKSHRRLSTTAGAMVLMLGLALGSFFTSLPEAEAQGQSANEESDAILNVRTPASASKRAAAASSRTRKSYAGGADEDDLQVQSSLPSPSRGLEATAGPSGDNSSSNSDNSSSSSQSSD